MRDKLLALHEAGVNIELTYISGETRRVQYPDYHIAGDKIVIKIPGQWSASVPIWVLENVEGGK